jgi:hypothetical protein
MIPAAVEGVRKQQVREPLKRDIESEHQPEPADLYAHVL